MMPPPSPDVPAAAPAPDLLPCPFCGGRALPDRTLRDGYADYQDDPDAWAHFIRCVSCAATGGWAKSATGAVRCWTMRTPAASSPHAHAP